MPLLQISLLLALSSFLRDIVQQIDPPLDRIAAVEKRMERDRIAATITTLASDELEGRGAGYSGEEQATVLIAKRFAEAGLAPAGDRTESGRSFFQRFEFHAARPEQPFEVLESRNVVGYLEGADRALRSEIIVIGAHHDGVGMVGQADPGRRATDTVDDAICNAANDNASSVAVLVEIARVIQASKQKPRRSIVFATFGAEEHALNGSTHYVAQPSFEWRRHVAMINLEKLGGRTELVTACTATSPVFARLRERVNRRGGIQVESVVDELITDTDHFPFALRRLPAMVIGTAGLQHVDTPLDSVDKIDMGRLLERGRYVVALLLEIADEDGPFEFTADTTGLHGAIDVELSAAERARLDDGGVKISTVVLETPAQRAGILPGDLILSIDGERVSDSEEFADASHMTPGTTRKWSVLRDGNRITVELARE